MLHPYSRYLVRHSIFSHTRHCLPSSLQIHLRLSHVPFSVQTGIFHRILIVRFAHSVYLQITSLLLFFVFFVFQFQVGIALPSRTTTSELPSQISPRRPQLSALQDWHWHNDGAGGDDGRAVCVRTKRRTDADGDAGRFCPWRSSFAEHDAHCSRQDEIKRRAGRLPVVLAPPGRCQYGIIRLNTTISLSLFLFLGLCLCVCRCRSPRLSLRFKG